MSVSILGQDVNVMQVPDDPLIYQAELEHQHVLYNKTGEQAVFHKKVRFFQICSEMRFSVSNLCWCAGEQHQRWRHEETG